MLFTCTRAPSVLRLAGPIKKTSDDGDGLLTEQTRSWHFDVRAGPTGLMETARAIRPDEVSLKAFYGNMF